VLAGWIVLCPFFKKFLIRVKVISVFIIINKMYWSCLNMGID